MTRQEFAVALFCYAHCPGRDCSECYEMSGCEICPANDDLRDQLRGISEYLYSRYRDDTERSEINMDELVSIFENRLEEDLE